MPAEVSDRVHALARRQRAQLVFLVTFINNDPPDDDADDDDDDSKFYPPQNDIPSLPDVDVVDDDSDNDNHVDDVPLGLNPPFLAGPIPGVDENENHESGNENDEIP
jgi:hypothetical protein